MLNKIVVRNVGVLRAVNMPDAPKLEKLTLFYGRNGRGKSTLTAVLRAARDGDRNTVMGRQSLGNGAAAPMVSLVGTGANLVFKDGAWNVRRGPIEVFDSAFIADNVYAGEIVDLSQIAACSPSSSERQVSGSPRTSRGSTRSPRSAARISKLLR